MSPNRYTKIDSEAVLEEAAAHSQQEPIVVFKHSTMCGISSRARRQINALTDPDDPPVYEVIIQEARPLSNKIATMLGIRHQSPQVIILYQGDPVFDASHGRITTEAVRAAINSVSPSS